jgi:hypothetical protein
MTSRMVKIFSSRGLETLKTKYWRFSSFSIRTISTKSLLKILKE